jgi:hypothetical protein
VRGGWKVDAATTAFADEGCAEIGVQAEILKEHNTPA